MQNLWASVGSTKAPSAAPSAALQNMVDNPLYNGQRLYGTAGQISNMNAAHAKGEFGYASPNGTDAAAFQAFQAAHPGYAQLGSNYLTGGATAGLASGEWNKQGAGAGLYYNDPSKIIYDPTYGYIAPATGAGYSDTKNVAGNLMPILGPAMVLSAGALGGAFAGAGAGAGAAEAGATAFPYLDAGAGITGVESGMGGAAAGGLGAIPAAGVGGVPIAGSTAGGAIGGIIPTSTLGLGTGGVVGAGAGLGTAAMDMGGLTSVLGGLGLSGSQIAQLTGSLASAAGGVGNNGTSTGGVGGNMGNLGSLLTQLLGAGGGLLSGQDLARQLEHIAERNAQLSDSLQQQPRLQYQQQLQNLLTPQGAQNFMNTDPGVLGMLDQARNKFQGDTARMGTGGTVFTDYLRNISDITGSQYNTRVNQLGNLGGFQFPANAGNYGTIATLGANANAGSYAGIGGILNNPSILGNLNDGSGILGAVGSIGSGIGNFIQGLQR